MAGIPVTFVGEMYYSNLGVGGGPMPGGPPLGIWGGAPLPVPTPPIYYPPVFPAHPIAGPPEWGHQPAHPIVLPPLPPSVPGVPTHPIVIPPPGYPAHPIALPPPPEGTKPPPPDGGWGYHPDFGWGYFPPQTEPGPKKK
jgi:hypothetical protein